MEQAAERSPQRARFCRCMVSGFHLAENLRLTQDHRIQSARHPQDVAYRRLVRVTVEVGANAVGVQMVIAAQPRGELVKLVVLDAYVQFGAIAGRQDCGLVHRRYRRQVVQRVTHGLAIDRHLLAQFDGCRAVINTKGNQ